MDPVAEADVYLAYGRDLQAEEILKEALRVNPSRLAIRLLLLEVYAKRRDTKGFEQLAIQLYAETKGTARTGPRPRKWVVASTRRTRSTSLAVHRCRSTTAPTSAPNR